MRKLGKTYPNLIAPTRDALEATGKFYVIENVPPAPVRKDIILDGHFFGLRAERRRVFELGGGLFLMQPNRGQKKYFAKHGELVSCDGNGGRKKGQPNPQDIKIWKGNWKDTRAFAMGIDWMTTMYGLNQAIPPAYTEWIGKQIINQYFLNL